MANFRFSVEIEAPPDRVWAVLMDVERWPEWTQSITSVQRLEPGPMAVGSRAKIVQPRLIPTVWTVTELDERTGAFTWVTGRPGIKVTGHHIVERIARGTRVTLALEYSGLLGALMAFQLKQLNWDYMTMEAQGLKQRSES